jgi:hypothetical protein
MGKGSFSLRGWKTLRNGGQECPPYAVGQAFEPAGGRDFPVPRLLRQYGRLESRPHRQTGMLFLFGMGSAWVMFTPL